MYSVIGENGNKVLELQSIHERLEEIKLYLEKEIAFKQAIIEGQGEQIGQLKTQAEEKDLTLRRLDEQLQECRQTNEGTRQLINKLLNDISNYQKDIEWYKRTYQQRSLWGYLKERFK
jgi:chromosome segregation ATPase